VGVRKVLPLRTGCQRRSKPARQAPYVVDMTTFVRSFNPVASNPQETPRLGPEHLNYEEELISIWQHVYGLRAELIAHLRLSREEGFEAQAEDHLRAAMPCANSLVRTQRTMASG